MCKTRGIVDRKFTLITGSTKMKVQALHSPSLICVSDKDHLDTSSTSTLVDKLRTDATDIKIVGHRAVPSTISLQ